MSQLICDRAKSCKHPECMHRAPHSRTEECDQQFCWTTGEKATCVKVVQ